MPRSMLPMALFCPLTLLRLLTAIPPICLMLPYSMHTDQQIEIVYADKGYAGAPNRNFLSLNEIADGIMRKNNINASLTETEIARNKQISKKRYIVEQYFGIATLFDDRSRARFTTIIKNSIDAMFRQFAFNLRKGANLLGRLPV